MSKRYESYQTDKDLEQLKKELGSLEANRHRTTDIIYINLREWYIKAIQKKEQYGER